MDATNARAAIAERIEKVRAELSLVRDAIEALPYDSVTYPTDCCADTLVRVALDALLTAGVNVAMSWDVPITAAEPITAADLEVAGDPRA